MIYTVTVNPSVDRLLSISGRLRPGQLHRASVVTDALGGKGINVSRALTAIGVPNRAFTVLGGAVGRLFQKNSRLIGVRVTPVWTDRPTRLNLKIRTDHPKTPTEINEPGPALSHRVLADFRRMLLSATRPPLFWVFSGSLCPGCPSTFYADLVRQLQHHKVRCAVDTSSAALVRALDAKPYLIKPNEEEMRQLCGKPLSAVADYAAEAEQLVRRRGIRLVVVSLGARGALYVTAQEAYHAIGPAVIARTHAGAGDALLAGIVAGFYMKMTLREAARWSVAVATSAVRRTDPLLCRRSDFKRLVRQVRLRVL